MNLLAWTACLTIAGALLAWLGRSWVALVVAFLVIGIVGSAIAYLGIETFRLASGITPLAVQFDNAYLQFVRDLVDLERPADALRSMPPQQRKLVATLVTAVVTVGVTLPFVMLANTIFVTSLAENLPATVESYRTELGDKLALLTRENRLLAEKVTELSRNAAAQNHDLQQLREALLPAKPAVENPPSSPQQQAGEDS